MIELLFSALAIYIVYYIVTVRKFDKYGNVKVSKKAEIIKKSKKETIQDNYMALPVEVKFFIKKYHVNIDNLNNRGLVKLMGLLLGLDIAIVTIIVGAIIKEDILIQVIIASIILIPFYLLSLNLLSRYFKKKGLINNEGIKKPKGNRK